MAKPDSPAAARAAAETRDFFVQLAERMTRNALVSLEGELEPLGLQIASIRVDTRNFANLAVSIETEPLAPDRR